MTDAPGRRPARAWHARRVSALIAVRRVAVLLGCLVVVAGLARWWLDGGPARQGFSIVGPGACPLTSASLVFPSQARDRLDRFVLPVGPPPVAPVRATVCRYVEGGPAVEGLALDPARTASLAGALAEPLTGWPQDALAAKRPQALTDVQLAGSSAAPCVADGSGAVLVFAYPVGPPVVVRVRTGPCADLTNGTITLRTPPAVTAALADLPRLPG
jgi:hypothetical protein